MTGGAPLKPRRSLLARIAGVPPARDIAEAICSNLTDVLNSRKSFGAFQPKLGLGDFQAHASSKGATDVLKQELLENVVGFEPRLKRPKIRRVGQDADFWLHFEVDGQAEGKTLRFRISFQTTVGGVRVQVLP